MVLLLLVLLAADEGIADDNTGEQQNLTLQ
jgi:hypothetical protein